VDFSSFVWSVYPLETYGKIFSLTFFTYLLENHNTCHWNVGDSRIWKMVIKVWDEQPYETLQCIEVHVFWICLELGLHFVMERANGCVFNAVWWSWLWVYFSGHASFSSRSLGYISQSVLQLLIPYDCQELHFNVFIWKCGIRVSLIGSLCASWAFPQNIGLCSILHNVIMPWVFGLKLPVPPS